MKHQKLLDLLLGLESYQQVLESLKTIGRTALCTGVMDGQKAHFLCALASHTKPERPVVIIAENSLRAAEVFSDISFFIDDVYLYPARDILSYYAESASKDILRRRAQVVDALLRGECRAIVLTCEAFFDHHMPAADFAGYVREYTVGDELNIDALSVLLIKLGYERAEAVEGAGQFAVRGGICDIFSPLDENPVRIEFWGDEIDSVRIIDAHSQRSLEKAESFKIFPITELIYEENELNNALEKIENEYNETLKIYEKNKLKDQIKSLKHHVGADIERMKQSKMPGNMEKYINYFYDNPCSFFDYLPKEAVLFFDEPARISEHSNGAYQEFLRMMESRLEGGQILRRQAALWRGFNDVLVLSQAFSRVLLSSLPRTLRDYRPDLLAHFEVKSQGGNRGYMDILKEDLGYFLRQNYAVCVLAGSNARAYRLAQELGEADLPAVAVDDLDSTDLAKGCVTLAAGAISRGFEYPQIGLFVVSSTEFFGEEKPKRKRAARKKRAARIESFTDLNVGDYVVHDNHGIGIYRGIEKIEIDGIARDYIKISYHGEGALFVAISQLDALQKYIGAENAKPKIHRLGGGEWQKAKRRVRGAVEIMAKELIELYAKRGAAQGYNFSQDDVWQQEFEESFPFEETQDQLHAIEDVKRDMESNRVMDRLVCGDVGYGKTEIAIRAAFKAVNDQKQVAILVPTTILAQQHYTTFCQRMKDFPVNIQVLSRFVSPKAQKVVLDKLKRGQVDIVIGTHRLLSKDIEFKDLGLIVVDEEQRFGVAHKEKLKAMRESVDVITLTATPIPRTLHMSLSGIRDMSLLEEPPQDRRPIATYVLEYSDQLVKDAIMREISRGGQVFYMRNRVMNIANVAGHIKKLVPEANVGFAHGQMGEDELENVMMDFIDGQMDVLVCTTIIESGLDIPNCNTIIIQDADHLGLSQLYQLRGRVGRSTRTSFAYLTYHKDKVLTEVAERRLSAIREFTEFGAGFKIAMRDLEIRGAGDLLGASQHGNMNTVGYEMYCRLLDEAVKEMRGEDVKADFETLIDININAFIPATYIPSELQKLEIYKRISHIACEQDFYDVQEEMEDRYGDLPKSAANLLDIALLKARAHDVYVTSVIQRGMKVIITFKPDAQIDPLCIADAVQQSRGRLALTIGANPFVTFKIRDEYEDFMGDLMRAVLGFGKARIS